MSFSFTRTVQYKEGVKCRKLGGCRDDCPYLMSENRLNWTRGYEAEKLAQHRRQYENN